MPIIISGDDGERSVIDHIRNAEIVCARQWQAIGDSLRRPVFEEEVIRTPLYIAVR